MSHDTAKMPDDLSQIDPTSRGDIIAERVRSWYERNRETWWERNNPGIWGSAPDRAGVHADNFILELISAVNRASEGYTP